MEEWNEWMNCLLVCSVILITMLAQEADLIQNKSADILIVLIEW
jgi:hypothetical protein